MGAAVLAVVAVVSGLVTIVVFAGDNGVWQTCWNHWRFAWGPLHAAVLWGALALGVVVCVAAPPEDRDWQRIEWMLAFGAVVIAVVNSLAYPRLVGSALVGGTLAVALGGVWTAAWIRSRRRRDGVSARRAAVEGMEQTGAHLSWVRNLMVGLWRGPRGRPAGEEGRRRMAGSAAVAAGVFVMILGFGVLGVGASAVAYGVAALVRDEPDGQDAAEDPESGSEAASSEPMQGASTTAPLTSSSAAGSVTEATAIPSPGPDCGRFVVGEGPDVDESVRIAAAEAVPSIRTVFPSLCPLGHLAHDEEHDVHRQPMATLDGDEGILVVAFIEGGYSVTFVSPDDGAAYAEIKDDPLDIGTPLPFRRCRDLWVQPFVTDGGLLAGLGVRREADSDDEANRPHFVWGATAEVLIDRHGHLLLPVGPPVDEDDVHYQGFEGAERVDDATGPGVELTPSGLLASC